MSLGHAWTQELRGSKRTRKAERGLRQAGREEGGTGAIRHGFNVVLPMSMWNAGKKETSVSRPWGLGPE